jgi:LacI family transcriptional regulator
MLNKRKSTIQDIAERAGVSKSTVSRVLTGSSPVAELKRETVLAAIAELDYQPNIHARGLAGGRSFTIGVLTQNFGSPFYDAILRGILQGLAGTDYSPIFADGRWQHETEWVAMQTLLGRHVDGLIVVGGSSGNELLCQIGEKVPVIVVARKIQGLSGHCVFVDNRAGAAMATQHLLEMGHRRIAHISGDMSQRDGIERKEGYTQALEDAGVEPVEDLIVEGDFRQPSGVLAVEMLLAKGQSFSAIFAANDQTAFGARLALFRRGIRVPDDVSIIGFDDQVDAAYMTPPLTTIRQPSVEMGELAATAILRLLQDKSVRIPTLRTELVMRESVARYL